MGYNKVDVFFDGNPTHKNKMQEQFRKEIADLGVEVKFHFMAPYSPNLNLVEYLIHLIRQKVLHHASCKKNLEDFEIEIKKLCESKELISKQQIINILTHIENMVIKNKELSLKRE